MSRHTRDTGSYELLSSKIISGGIMMLAMLMALPAAGADNAAPANAKTGGAPQVTATRPAEIVPPRLVQPCAPGACPFAGQSVTVIVSNNIIWQSLAELKQEFEQATGARLEVVRVPFRQNFENFLSDVINRTGKYDASIAGAWWLGELVSGDYLLSYDKYYNDPRFPKWNVEDVLPTLRNLLSYDGRKYMVANDHDGQVMYYRRDLLADPQHQAAFRKRYGYPLAVPATWAQFRDVAEYFNGKDLNGDGVPDYGVSMHLKAGAQGMFHFMSFSAPFVIGPENPQLYWFHPQTMKPLIESPGHVKALATLVDLVHFGPRDMPGWDLAKSWDLFVAGRAALTFTWGNLGGLAQENGTRVKGKVGVAPLPGTSEYYSIAQGRWVKTAQPNVVGNTTGGSWAGVISKYSKAPEATYYLLALMATREKSEVYAARGSDGIDPGRSFHFLPPDGGGRIDIYLKAGWDEADVRDYLHAYYLNFTSRMQLPYLRIPGTYSYWQAFDMHLAAAAAGQMSPEAALKAAAVDFEEITIRLGRERQRVSYRASLGF